MRLAHFFLNDSPRHALVQEGEADGRDHFIELDGHPLADDQVKPTSTRYPVDGDGTRLLSPVIPSKVYGLAKNHEAHAQFTYGAGHSEIAHAPEGTIAFAKSSTSVISPDSPIVYLACSKDVNLESEVAVMMSRTAKNVTVENAMDYVLGFVRVNDMTLRDLQDIDPMWTRAEGSDTSRPLDPWIVVCDDPDWKDVKIPFTLNGEDVPVVSGITVNLIHGIPGQIAAVSSFFTLLLSDVVMIGTLSTFGHLNPGDETIIHAEGIDDLHSIIVRA